MSKPRTARTSLLVCITPERLPQGEETVELSLEDVVRLFPEGRAELLGLREGGWEYFYGGVCDGGASLDDDTPLLDVCMSFTKEFASAQEADVAADARACGLTDGFAPSDFSWVDVPLDGDSYTWDLSGEFI